MQDRADTTPSSPSTSPSPSTSSGGGFATSMLQARQEGRVSNQRRSRSRTLSRFRDHVLDRRPITQGQGSLLQAMLDRRPLTYQGSGSLLVEKRTGGNADSGSLEGENHPDRSPLTKVQLEEANQPNRSPLTKVQLEDRQPLTKKDFTDSGVLQNRHMALLDKDLLDKELLERTLLFHTNTKAMVVRQALEARAPISSNTFRHTDHAWSQHLDRRHKYPDEVNLQTDDTASYGDSSGRSFSSVARSVNPANILILG